MLADPDFGAMVQAIGQASLGADEKTIWHLTKCYCESLAAAGWRRSWVVWAGQQAVVVWAVSAKRPLRTPYPLSPSKRATDRPTPTHH